MNEKNLKISRESDPSLSKIMSEAAPAEISDSTESRIPFIVEILVLTFRLLDSPNKLSMQIENIHISSEDQVLQGV